MSTCKFFKFADKWLYKIRPGFYTAQPVNREILLAALGVTGLYKTEVTIPEGKTPLKVIIENWEILEIKSTQLTFSPIEEFVVRMPETGEPEIAVFNGASCVLSHEWVQWKMLSNPELTEQMTIYIGAHKVADDIEPKGQPGAIRVTHNLHPTSWTVTKTCHPQACHDREKVEWHW